jgi:hypothetical protein
MAYTTINKGSSYFNPVLYTGDGTTSRSVTGVGFKPDWVWVKGRSTSYYHGLWDAVRTNKSALYSNATDAEDTTTGGTLGSFNSDGFTTPSVSGGFINNSGTTYVAWNWLANNTSGSSNTSGSITSTVAANTTSGFSIVSYTGTRTPTANQSIGHGLGAVPSMMIVKNRTTGTRGWRVYHKSLGSPDKELILNSTAAVGTDTATWQNTTPTSSLFYVGASGETNNIGDNFIAYCFAEVKGYSKFGSYTGNGSADGTFVYTGFKPAFVICKSSSNAFSWVMHDSKRPGYNATNLYLYAQATNTEGSDIPHDFVSNGFKIRSTFSDTNGSGMTYIYMAFAENPFVTSGGIPVTAR